MKQDFKLPYLDVSNLPLLKIPACQGITINTWINQIKSRVVEAGAPQLALSYKPKHNEFAFLERNIGWFSNLEEKAKQGQAEDMFIEKVTSGNLPKAGEPIPPPDTLPVSNGKESELKLVSNFVMRLWGGIIHDANWYIIMNGVKNFHDLEANLIYYYKVLFSIKNFVPRVIQQSIDFNLPYLPKNFAELFDVLTAQKSQLEIDEVTKSIAQLVLASNGSPMIFDHADNVCQQVFQSAKLVSTFIDSNPQALKKFFYHNAVDAVYKNCASSEYVDYIKNLVGKDLDNLDSDKFEQIFQYVCGNSASANSSASYTRKKFQPFQSSWKGGYKDRKENTKPLAYSTSTGSRVRFQYTKRPRQSNSSHNATGSSSSSSSAAYTPTTTTSATPGSTMNATNAGNTPAPAPAPTTIYIDSPKNDTTNTAPATATPNTTETSGGYTSQSEPMSAPVITSAGCFI